MLLPAPPWVRALQRISRLVLALGSSCLFGSSSSSIRLALGTIVQQPVVLTKSRGQQFVDQQMYGNLQDNEGIMLSPPSPPPGGDHRGPGDHDDEDNRLPLAEEKDRNLQREMRSSTTRFLEVDATGNVPLAFPSHVLTSSLEQNENSGSPRPAVSARAPVSDPRSAKDGATSLHERTSSGRSSHESADGLKFDFQAMATRNDNSHGRYSSLVAPGSEPGGGFSNPHASSSPSTGGGTVAPASGGGRRGTMAASGWLEDHG